jgi:hypothetical protein
LIPVEGLSERRVDELSLLLLNFVHTETFSSLVFFLDSTEPRHMRSVEDVVSARFVRIFGRRQCGFFLL